MEEDEMESYPTFTYQVIGQRLNENIQNANFLIFRSIPMV